MRVKNTFFMGKFVDYDKMVGVRFAYLTLMEVLPVEDKWRKARLKCICGNEIIALISNVRSGKTKSCGCKRFPTGEMVKHPLQKIWTGIKQRCNNPKCEAYVYYGAKGVRMCKEWENDFPAFFRWCMDNGWEDGLEIDKDIKGSGLLYSPNDCSIVSHLENMSVVRRKPKLTQEQALYLLESPLSGRKLAKQMGITRHVITEVRNDKYWQKYE